MWRLTERSWAWKHLAQSLAHVKFSKCWQLNILASGTFYEFKNISFISLPSWIRQSTSLRITLLVIAIIIFSKLNVIKGYTCLIFYGSYHQMSTQIFSVTKSDTLSTWNKIPDWDQESLKRFLYMLILEWHVSLNSSGYGIVKRGFIQIIWKGSLRAT